MLLLFTLFLFYFFQFLLYFVIYFRYFAEQLFVFCLLFVFRVIFLLLNFSFLLIIVIREAQCFFHDLYFAFLVLELLQHLVLVIIHCVFYFFIAILILFVVTLRGHFCLSLLLLFLLPPQLVELVFIDPFNSIFFAVILLDLCLQLHLFQGNFPHDFSFSRVLHVRVLLQCQADAFEVFFETLSLRPELLNIHWQLHCIDALDTLQLRLFDNPRLESLSA